MKTVAKGAYASALENKDEVAVQVTPGAGMDRLSLGDDGTFMICVTQQPEGGRATKQVIRLLARALGVAPSRIEQISGGMSRRKVFRISR